MPLARPNTGPERETEAGSEERAVGDRARQRAQGSVFAAQQIVGEIQGSEHVERTADNADQRERVLVHGSGMLTMRHGLAIVQHQKRIARRSTR